MLRIALILTCLFVVTLVPTPTAQAYVCTFRDLAEGDVDGYVRCQLEQANCTVFGWLRDPPRPPVCLD